MRRGAAYRHPAWFARPANRVCLINELREVSTSVATVKCVARRRNGFALRVTLTPTGLGPQQVTIEFDENGRDTPHAYVPGPGSPHRYADGSLCMWYPHDPPSQRWHWNDGGVALAGHICAHLIREAWWRQTGEWVGEEVRHD